MFAHDVAQELPRRVLHVLADHLHVELHRVPVRMHLDDGDFVALLIDVGVERDQPRLAHLDELDEFGEYRAKSSRLPSLIWYVPT